MACGLASHVSLETAAVDPAATAAEAAAPPVRFAALRQRDCAGYLVGGMLSMMADNIEHVITYWVLWETFHSPGLAGFAVISHWLPFLLLSVYFGGLADRYDCRRVIQAAQVLFMAVSAAWGVLFLLGGLQVWIACVLLVLHGIAGALWTPAEQLMLHDFVGPAALPSAVRLNATARSLGVLLGPAVGSALLLGLGPTAGIFVNVAIYLPLTLFLLTTRFTGHTRESAPSAAPLSFRDAWTTLREVRGNPTVMAMVVLGGMASLFVGASLQSAMPIFAQGFGVTAGVAYGVLLFANGVGGVVGGLLLEVTDRVRPTVATATWATLALGGTTALFALTTSYPVAAASLLVGGVAALAAQSIGQTVVQLEAPPDKRGRVVGVYGMSALGLRTGSGLTVGVLGAAIGLQWSLAASALCLCVGTVAVYAYQHRARVAAARAPAA